MYTQVLFAFDRVKKLAPQHPEWKTKQPFKALLEGDMKTVGASGMKGLMEIIMATHSGMTAAEFEKEVSNWLATNKQSKFKRSVHRIDVYQPQLELLDYLRANGFKTFIVSGGGIAVHAPHQPKKPTAFRRNKSWAPAWSPNSRFKDGKPVLVRHAENRLHQR